MTSRPRSRKFATALLVAASLPLHAAETALTANQSLPMPPRLQWNANDGYCGETSFISAGLYFGQYCSQYTARALASPGIPQSLAASQLLLGVNDLQAAQAMHLAATAWKSSASRSSEDFLVWVESQILAGRPVAIGVFTNEYLFYNDKSPNAGDPTYDHIVPVLGISPSSPSAAPAYNPADALTFSDNGLWNPSGPPAFIFTYLFGDFQLTRKQANAPSGPIYSLKTGGPNYGIAFSGVLDLNHDTVPVRLATSVDSELPAMINNFNTPPPARNLGLTVTVTLPDQNAAYNLYRYDNFVKVPNSKFNASAGRAAAHWRIPPHSGPVFVVKVQIRSNETAVFRAVKSTAP